MRITLAVLALLMATPAAFGDGVQPGPSPEVAAFNTERGPETFRIRIVNREGGAIEVSRDGGEAWASVGRVTIPATAVNPAGYTASAWAANSSVAASAVNALHLKVANHPETGRGIILSVVPAGQIVGAAREGQQTSIATDIPAGTAIFGGGLAPYVNSPTYLERDALTPLVPDWTPAVGDTIVITVTEPKPALHSIELDNSFGGLVTLRYADGEETIIGGVLRPVVGIGRFDGTRDAAPGRIRANHPGVLDVSTSPLGMVGGFQIVPSGHADSPETTYIRTGTQWMVVGALNMTNPSWEGIAPLFAGYLRPDYRPDDLMHEDWMRRLLSRSMVQVRFHGGEWELMPRIAIDPEAQEDPDHRNRGREGLWRIAGSLQPHIPSPATANIALQGVTHLRILLPQAQYWPEPGESELR